MTHTHDNLTTFIGKSVKIIITSGNTVLTYVGKIIKVDTDTILISDRRYGEVILMKSAITQIIPESYIRPKAEEN